MTQEEILYNKRCAKFLGWHNAGMKDLELWKSSENFVGVQTSELKFHSDWNWIMEIVDAIEKLEHKSVYFSKTKLGEYTIEIAHETPTYFNKSRENDKTFFVRGNDKKEAVVQAINKFLIWYNE